MNIVDMTILDLKKNLSHMPHDALLVFRCASAANQQFVFYRWKWRGPKLMTIELNWIDDQQIGGFQEFPSLTVQDVLESNLPDDTEFELSGTGTSDPKPTAFARAVVVDID